MKIIRAILIVIVLLICAFLSVGIFSSGFSLRIEQEINKPLEKSFAVFMDGDQMNKWLPSLDSVIILEKNDNEVGSKFKLFFTEDGKTIEMLETVTGYDKNKIYNVILENEDVFFKIENTFEAIDSLNTKIIVNQSGYGKNLIMKSVLSLFESMTKERQIESYNLLKKTIESSGI